MTPEERFTKIENAIKALTENQARHDTQIERNERQIEKNSAAIRDLIVVSRTLVDAQIRTDAEIKDMREALRDAHMQTDAKLKALIDTVDRIIRNRENGKRSS